MNFNQWRFTGLVLAFLAYCLPGHAGQVLAFNFVLNHPLVYQVETESKNVTDRTGQVAGRSQNSLTRVTDNGHYKIRLTPTKKNPDGTWTIYYQPFDYHEEQDMDGNAGHLLTIMHGLDVTGTQNGITVMDTSKGIGENQAQLVKNHAYPAMFSGYLDMTARGQIVRLNGDLPFVDVWTNKLKQQLGLFNVELTDQPISQGFRWEKNLNIMDLTGLKLGANGVTLTNIFSVTQMPASENSSMASIDQTVAMNLKDLDSNFESMGQSTTINISEFNVNSMGSFKFDCAHGQLVEYSSDSTANISTGMLIQGNTVNSVVDLHQIQSFKLLPSDGASPDSK